MGSIQEEALRHASYKVKEQGIPIDLSLDKDVSALLHKEIKLFRFDFEREVGFFLFN